MLFLLFAFYNLFLFILAFLCITRTFLRVPFWCLYNFLVYNCIAFFPVCLCTTLYIGNLPQRPGAAISHFEWCFYGLYFHWDPWEELDREGSQLMAFSLRPAMAWEGGVKSGARKSFQVFQMSGRNSTTWAMTAAFQVHIHRKLGLAARTGN